jgi:hypothetical protein
VYVPRKRWRWIEDSEYWKEFAAWLDNRPYEERVEFTAGLDELSRSGPVGNTPQVGEDLYKVYACAGRVVLWLIIGIARPGERELLPLVWGTPLDENRIARTIPKAAKKLRDWRETV